MTVATVEGQPPAYRDPTRPIPDRVEDLLERMAIEEKVGQIGSVWSYQLIKGREFSRAAADSLLRDGIGHVTRLSGATDLRSVEAARMANAIQRYLVETTRLGIPAIIHEEICSGLMAREATVFPQAIGVASTWDPDLVHDMAGAVRILMRERGAHHGLSPVLDIARDPRWGRTEETFGEDPHLVAAMGVAFVRGLQGDDLGEGVIATPKHFVGYGASEGGLNWAPPHLPPRELADIHLHPFEAAVVLGGARSMMHGYHELDGVPCAADRHLLTELLRDEWGFEGTVVSDYFAIRQLADYHQVAETAPEAAVLALEAGVDVELPGTDCFGSPLLAAIRTGTASMSSLDTAVRRVLTAKFELGLFEAPYVDAEAISARSKDHEALAREIAGKSVVLLKNDGILPLAGDVGSIAVIGPNADSGRNLLGDYSYDAHVESLLDMRDGENVFSIPRPEELGVDVLERPVTTILQALQARFGEKVRYAPGCRVNDPNTDGFGEAIGLAASSDVAIVVAGDRAGLTAECTSGEGRDRLSLELPGVQEGLVRAIVETGTPVVLVLITGRPCASPWAHENSAAVVLGWLPGQMGGEALADVLTGVVNPGGKLPITYPRTAGQLPVYYGHKVSGGRSHWQGDYVDGEVSPLYPFGFGLSYTTFEISNPDVAPDKMQWNGEVTVSLQLTNTGDRDGTEVVQLYVRDPAASVTRPVLELKGFARVNVEAGHTRRITFGLPVGQVGFCDRDLRYVIEPGVIEVFVGVSSAELILAGRITVIPDPSGREPEKKFAGWSLVS